MYGDRHNGPRTNDRCFRFCALATGVYGWSSGTVIQQYRLWTAGVRDIRIHDATLCLIEMADSAEDLGAIIRRCAQS